MNLYTTKLKVQQIKQAKQDFFNLTGIPLDKVFTEKTFFYFIPYGGYKYVHKESLRLVYTNGDTYSHELNTQNYCRINCKRFIPDFQQFLINHELLCDVEDLGEFYKLEYQQGEILTSISRSDFFYLRDHRDFNGYTPFYNSMCYNMVRTDKGIKVIDLKHFEKIDDKEFFVYMHNKEANINILYVEDNIDSNSLTSIIEHLERDYKVQDIIRYKYSQ